MADSLVRLLARTVAGRNLRELELRARAAATVIAVVRDGSSQLNPEPGLSLEAGDCLVLVGSHQEIDRAFDHLAALETGEGSA